MFFSVIIPIYNSSSTIQNTINSVLNQTYQDFEIVVIDDCSNDIELSMDLIQEINDSRIRVIKSEIKGNAAIARNKGISVAQGSYIAFLDSDDEWQPNKLEEFYYVLEKHILNESNVIVYSQARILNSRNKEIIHPSKGIKASERLASYKIVNGGAMYTPTICVSRQLALKSLFDPYLKRHEDFAFCLNLERIGAIFEFIPMPLTTVYWNKNIERRRSDSTWRISYKFYLRYKNYFVDKEKEIFLLRNIVYRMLLVRNYGGFFYFINRFSLLNATLKDSRVFIKNFIKGIV